MKKIVKIGSRESKLALWQAEYVAQKIKCAHPDIETEIITMKTTGDKILDRNLDQIGGKGLFIKELELALLEKRTDISVHSLKDMPMEVSKDLPILAFSEREDPRDVLIFKNGTTEENVNVIGSSSRRRTVQLKKLYPECTFTGMRGNVQTRLRKLDEGQCDATVLAMAGLKRLGLETIAGKVLSIEEVLPAAGQGILAIQGRAGEDYSYLDCISDKESTVAALAERAFVRTLDGGCSSPIAAYASVQGKQVILTGLYYDEDKEDYITGKKSGTIDQAEQLGITLARELKEKFGKV